MGVAVARALIGALGVLLILAGILLVGVGGPAAGLTAALTFLIPGVVLVAAVVLERTRYRSLHAERRGDAAGPGGGEPHAPESRFQPTGERFLDPTTHVSMRVWVDPATGERRYVPEG